MQLLFLKFSAKSRAWDRVDSRVVSREWSSVVKV